MRKSLLPLILLFISFATIAVLVYSRWFTNNANLILDIFMISTSLSAIIFAFIGFVSFLRRNQSIYIKEIASIVEDLNTEIVIWTSDCSAVFMNKKLRTLLDVKLDDFDHKSVIMKIFNLEKIDTESISMLLAGNSEESNFLSAHKEMQYIVWSTSKIKQINKCSLYFSTGFNFTEMKRIQTELNESHNRYNISMALSEIGILTGQHGYGYTASPETVRMLGLDDDFISFEDFRRRIHPNDRTNYDMHFKMLTDNDRADDEIISIEMRVKSRGDTYRWYSYRFKSIRNYMSYTDIIGGAFLDITHDREKDMLIEKLAYVDEITDIPNRNKLLKIGQETFECCDMLSYSYWVIVIDIDRFHLINDTCGYEAGNLLLRNFAHNLYKYISVGGMVARISGDNFAVIVRDYGDADLPRKTIEMIQKDLSRLDVGLLSNQHLTCSAGYCKMPDDGCSFLDVLEHAEFALQSGADTRGNISMYENRMHDAIIGDTALEKALADAIKNKQLCLFYQPKIDLKTGRIIGVEALVRWLKPDGTMVSPGVFVPIAENSQLIDQISEYVLNEACQQNMLWQRMGYPEIIMSINFASSDFYKKDLKDRVFEALVRSGLSAEWLEIELTESLALDDIDYAVSQMNQLRALGVKLAMDDFGTGYSSLSYIQILPITLLKLDQSFIVNIDVDDIAFEIVSAVIRIAKSKKIKVIAEGIETQKQADILKNAGCDYAQGYFYGKPMPAEKIQEYLDNI